MSPGVDRYLHAVWFSVQTSRTIGYGSYGMAPNPDCLTTNVYVMFQARGGRDGGLPCAPGHPEVLPVALQCVVATFLDTVMFGIVFTRFTNPMLRKPSCKFSKHIVMHKRSVGRGFAWCLTARVANIRAHGMLNPTVKLLLNMRDKEVEQHPGLRLLRPGACVTCGGYVLPRSEADFPPCWQMRACLGP